MEGNIVSHTYNGTNHLIKKTRVSYETFLKYLNINEEERHTERQTETE